MRSYEFSFNINISYLNTLKFMHYRRKQFILLSSKFDLNNKKTRYKFSPPSETAPKQPKTKRCYRQNHYLSLKIEP